MRLVKNTVAPEHMSLYPTMDSIAEAVAYIESQVPVTQPNHMFGLLMMFQNTILKELSQSTNKEAVSSH